MIEMIVTVGIMVLLSGAALTSYLSFRDRKQASSDARLVMEHLRMVRVKATAVDVPLSLSTPFLPIPGIQNYTVTIGSTSITTDVHFTSQTRSNYIPAINFTSGTTLTPTSLVFLAKSGSLVGGATTIVVCGVGRYRYTMAVNESGIVSDPLLVPSATCP